MIAKPALKEGLNVVHETPKTCNEKLHKQLIFYLDTSGNSQSRVAGMMGRSEAAISQYVHKKYKGDIEKFEKDLKSFLRRERDLQISLEDPGFVETSVAKEAWAVFQHCDRSQDQGIFITPSGMGNTTVANEYKRQNRSTILITADITTRSVGSILYLISKKLGAVSCRSNAVLLSKIVDTLKDSRRLLIIDEAQFLSWEAFEAIRKIHDCCGIGVVFVAMPRLYSQMRGGNKAYLFDQIFSRIGPRCHIKYVKKSDVKLIADKIYPGLNNRCLEYLFKKATQPGKFRGMVKLLKFAIKISNIEDTSLTLQILKEADKFLSFS